MIAKIGDFFKKLQISLHWSLALKLWSGIFGKIFSPEGADLYGDKRTHDSFACFYKGRGKIGKLGNIFICTEIPPNCSKCLLLSHQNSYLALISPRHLLKDKFWARVNNPWLLGIKTKLGFGSMALCSGGVWQQRININSFILC